MKISIVTVTLNCSSVIYSCIDSVSGQSNIGPEHVVIDGASTDGTLDILKAKSSRFAALVSESDSGIYEAMNKGLELAKGEIIGILNSDDFYANSSILNRVVSVFSEDPHLDACYGDVIYTDKVDTSRIVRYWKSSDFSFGAFSRGWCPPHPAFFVRRSVYERFGVFDLSYRIAADVELMMRLLERRKIRVRYIPEVWVKMRLGGTTNRSFRNIWVQNQEVIRALRSYGLPANQIRFFSHKLFSKGKQFFSRPIR